MRAMFGLVSILVVVGIIVWLMGQSTPVTVKTGQKARVQVEQMAGRDTDTGENAMDSASFDDVSTNGKMTALRATKVEPEGAYARYFGLQPNDVVVAVIYQGARQDVRDFGDSELAKAQVSDAYSRKGSLVVKRGTQEMTLPLPKTAVSPAAGATPTAAPAEKKKDSVQQQLDAIQSVGQ